ncbi:MAG: aminotransferase class I/II-fold pyridoxal phosphate-dependent enzyme, partial [Synechococcaceae bacterium WB7_1B_046]|nr:aminotransferase class I/II-fold pyridoxal phosphate-dependent enzyme [Synechococcaceae bacterium WB7_1B_046]
MPDHSPSTPHRHGGNRQERAEVLGCKPAELLDLSASLVPFGPPSWLPRALRRAIAIELTPYPDRRYASLRAQIASHHGLDPDWVLPGNGAAELFTWAARDSAAFHSLLPQPGFNDYCRALDCWHGPWQALPLQLQWAAAFPQAFTAALAAPLLADQGRALWITNPHNPSGQLWCRKSLELLLPQFGLVVVDEAFLTLLPNGEQQSLVPLIDKYPNLVVVRSLTKLFAIAGLRLGYAIAHPDRLARWASWRDPWPVNGLAAAVGGPLLADQNWAKRV